MITIPRLSYGLKTKRKMRKSDEKINFIIGKTMIVTEDSPLKALLCSDDNNSNMIVLIISSDVPHFRVNTM